MLKYNILAALITATIAMPVAQPQLDRLTGLVGLGGSNAAGGGANAGGGLLGGLLSNLPVDVGVLTNPVGALGVTGNGNAGSASTAPKPAVDNFSNKKP